MGRISDSTWFKVMLKVRIVQILFSQMRHNYAKYTIETFKVDGIIVAYQMESMA
jgi:hypothetical protein